MEFASGLKDNKVVLGVVVIVAALLLAGAFDAVSNGGRAYANVSINGVDVGGMNEEEIRSTLEGTFGERANGTEVTIEIDKDVDENAKEKTESDGNDERDLLAELVVAEYTADSTSWTATSDSLKAGFDYDAAIEQAMAEGRGAGPFSRIGLLITGADIPMTVRFDDKSLETLASNIDKSVGSTRVDATAIVEGGEARVLPGRDGQMVDRTWLVEALTDAFMSEQDRQTLTANVVDAPSRTTIEQAQATCDAINRALQARATFTYNSDSWTAEGADFADWTRVNVVEDGEGYALDVVIDTAAAAPELVEGLDVNVSADDVIVSFEVDGDDVTVHTSGSGSIPELNSALKNLEQALYGEGGYAWNSQASPDISIQVEHTDAPESLAFDEALSLGLITVIGEFTTEFSDYEGTENRNYNIKLCADILNNTVAEANGGTWSFNDHSGDTNQDPPFASAGSIVNGEFVDSIGGGICQVATTVFNAVYEAGLDWDMRFNHTIYIASYPDGRDASVDYPDRDFVWTNDLPSDVLVKFSYTDTTITCKLYSVYTGYEVETELGTWEEGAKFSTTFEYDDDLSAGQGYQKKYGENGKSFSVTRTVRDKDGNVISGPLTFSSDYPAQDEVFVVGPGTDTSTMGSNAVQAAAQSTAVEDIYDTYGTYDYSGYADYTDYTDSAIGGDAYAYGA